MKQNTFHRLVRPLVRPLITVLLLVPLSIFGGYLVNSPGFVSFAQTSLNCLSNYSGTEPRNGYLCQVLSTGGRGALIGLDSNDIVDIDPDGLGIEIAGISVTPPATAATIGEMSHVWYLGTEGEATDDATFWQATRTYTLTTVGVRVAAVNSSTFTLMLEKVGGGEACGSGTDILQSSLDLTAVSTDAVSDGVLTSTSADLDFDYGEGICADWTGNVDTIDDIVVSLGFIPD